MEHADLEHAVIMFLIAASAVLSALAGRLARRRKRKNVNKFDGEDGRS